MSGIGGDTSVVVKSERLPIVLQVLLGVVVLLLLLSMVRSRTPSMNGAMHTLMVGDTTEAARRDALEAVLHHAEHGKGRGMARMAWSAALALGDEKAAAKALERLSGAPVAAGEVLGDLDRLSLGEPPIRSLYEALMAKASGAKDNARAALLRAERSGQLYALHLVVAEARSRRTGL